MIHCRRWKEERRRHIDRLNKQINKWCVSDVTIKIMKEQSQGKRRYKQFEIHSNCFYQLSLPSHFLQNVLVSCTWWLTTMGSELITQRLLRRDEETLEKRPPATAFTPSQACTSKFSAVWPFVSGEQVGFYLNLSDSRGRNFSCGCNTRLPPGFPHFLPLSSTGSKDTEVTQTPRHLVRGKEQKAKMECFPIKGHSYVYWYRKRLGEELKFLVYCQNDEIVEKTEEIDKQILVQCPQNTSCSLEVQSTDSGDSALYFCASSQSTVLNVSFSLNTNSSWTQLRK